jgi:hypothetical protein
MSDLSQQIREWSQHFTHQVQHKPNSTSFASSQSALNDGINQQSNAKLIGASEIPTNSKLSTIQSADLPASIKTILQQDQKLWLQSSQQQLTKAFAHLILNDKQAFIPSWSTIMGQVKSPMDLSNWLNILVTPKANPNNGGINIWPNNLSNQSQLNQTINLLLANTPNGDQDSLQSQILRQLQSISHSLMKIQYEQVQARLTPQQPDINHGQFSIPYLHQNHMQWAELEYRGEQSKTEVKQKTTGWHLILRFAQNTKEAFAIESQLKQEQTQITLWATDNIQLKKLHGEIPMLKEKLIQAGFKVDCITSKHGSPATLNTPLQQSLVDVRT